MHDVRAIRDDPQAYARAWASRGVADAQAQVEAIVAEDARLRAALTGSQEAQARRNAASKLIGAAKARGDQAGAAAPMAEVEALKGDLSRHGEEGRAAGEALQARLAALPNLAAPDVPEGADEHGNVERKRWSDPRVTPEGHARAWTRLNAPKDHVALGEALGMMDFEAAARMSGARFVVLKRELARLERALGHFMIDIHTVGHGYTEISPPLLVRDEALFGTGQLPKFKDDLFAAESTNWDAVDVAHSSALDGDFEKLLNSLQSGETRGITVEDLRTWNTEAAQGVIPRLKNGEFTDYRFLIPTAEVSLTNLVREQITPEAELPLRFTALTPCFRSEAGSHGRDTRGMIRQHQFTKCELVSITTPEQAEAEHERMTTCAEAVLERLGLPYRRMLLCAGDMGFTARKTYDLEVWLPSQAAYREISSCSDCGDFQARRMDARFKITGEKGTQFVHTLNGSALAVGRTLVALMENYQDEGGRIALPPALQPYIGGMTHIGGER